ncbi:GNAT family N-acetyltransferase [Dactylosporangium sp. NBC_01737]|uniref:GNAT family N-acetyltransferase n=1 Tax=Dactylosporangium sp. NBC_01737 TaxID=2975959 RepID=UPI002E105C38|nr:GNAT family N-acetyltransferase [Dactylosporangium sp. NBC_01737]
MTDADIDRVAAVVVDEPVGWIGAERFRAELAQRMYRPEWTWIAEQEGRIVARALWWGLADGTHPVALDCLTVDPSVPDRVALAAEVLAAGMSALGAPVAPQYNVSVTGGWRDDPATVAAVEWRRAAALAAGLTEEVERLRFEWTPAPPGTGTVPVSESRLVYRDAGDEEFLDVFRRVAAGSLDAQTRRSLSAEGVEATARAEMDFYLGCPGERSWWRIATTPDGTVVGLAVPSATPYHRNVGYLGVVPEMRGRGYVDELLAEITRIHAADGAPVITATTDAANAPMAAAFVRAGYRVTEIRLVYTAPPSTEEAG